jgi:hypothetical protein
LPPVRRGHRRACARHCLRRSAPDGADASLSTIYSQRRRCRPLCNDLDDPEGVGLQYESPFPPSMG